MTINAAFVATYEATSASNLKLVRLPAGCMGTWTAICDVCLSMALQTGHEVQFFHEWPVPDDATCVHCSYWQTKL